MMYFSCHKMVLFDERDEGLGVAESPIEENAISSVLPDKEEEWVICIEFNGWVSNSKTHFTPSTRYSLCPLFIYFHKRLVGNVGEKQVSLY